MRKGLLPEMNNDSVQNHKIHILDKKKVILLFGKLIPNVFRSERHFSPIYCAFFFFPEYKPYV